MQLERVGGAVPARCSVSWTGVPPVGWAVASRTMNQVWVRYRLGRPGRQQAGRLFNWASHGNRLFFKHALKSPVFSLAGPLPWWK